MAATTSGNVFGAVGPRWWDRAIKGLVPVALSAAIIAHAFPFLNPTLGPYPTRGVPGFSAFFSTFFVLTVAPSDPWVEAFSLPLIAAAVGLILLRRRGPLGSGGPLVCALVGSTALGSAYFFDAGAPWAYGYYAAEAFFLIAAVAAAVRLILLRRGQPVSDAPVPERYETAISASQELLSRYRKLW